VVAFIIKEYEVEKLNGILKKCFFSLSWSGSERLIHKHRIGQGESAATVFE
jgi:hypothetical protein